ESAHLAGIGEPDGESYYTFYDGKPGGIENPNVADCWSHYVHILSGQPPDVPSGPGHAPQAATKVHVVQSGDYLIKIAKKYYGDEAQWRKIYEANRAIIGPDPNKIFPGQRLTIP